MSGKPLSIAMLTYRGHPYVGGQGVYVRHLSRELVTLGHQVEVVSGPPYPDLDARVAATWLPSLDLYREPDPFRVPRLGEFNDWVDVLEYGVTSTAQFAEPLTFSLRAARSLLPRRTQFDIVHDNQCLGYGLLRLVAAGVPVLGTIHHPITVDRRLEKLHARSRWERFTKDRFYSFTSMQSRVAQRLTRIVTVSENSLNDIVSDHGVARDRLHIVPVGVDHTTFRPRPDVVPVPGRLMTTTSSDVAMKGLVVLLEALAKVRTERDGLELVVVGRPKDQGVVAAAIGRLGLDDVVRFVQGVSDDELVRLYAEAQLAVVPSLYEGFSLPAIEAMASGVPLLTTTGGALPEVVGRHGHTALLVAPGDVSALTRAIVDAIDSPNLRATVGAAGRQRTISRYSWRATAESTVEHYRAVLDMASPPSEGRQVSVAQC